MKIKCCRWLPRFYGVNELWSKCVHVAFASTFVSPDCKWVEVVMAIENKRILCVLNSHRWIFVTCVSLYKPLDFCYGTNPIFFFNCFFLTKRIFFDFCCKFFVAKIGCAHFKNKTLSLRSWCTECIHLLPLLHTKKEVWHNKRTSLDCMIVWCVEIYIHVSVSHTK